MGARESDLAYKLAEEHELSVDEYALIIDNRDDSLAALLADLAVAQRRSYYGNEVFIRGLIEFTNHCRNDCLYCGIRASNLSCERYRLDDMQILECCRHGYGLGFRTFVLQGGEDPHYDDARLYGIVSRIRGEFHDCAITLSIGERTPESYRLLHEAGADRYLLRHETASRWHYERLHPDSLSYDTRMQCLEDLREIGYQVGAGFMVGSPYQTSRELARDLDFIARFKPDMCGIGPFVPHHATVFANETGGTVELTCLLLSMIRLIHPPVNLPATTALGTIDPEGREKGIMAGANVIMPNLSPQDLRSKYEIYDNKLSSGAESAECLEFLSGRMESIGYKLVIDRGDTRKHPLSS